MPYVCHLTDATRPGGVIEHATAMNPVSGDILIDEFRPVEIAPILVRRTFKIVTQIPADWDYPAHALLGFPQY